jgi:hypothetical protein
LLFFKNLETVYVSPDICKASSSSVGAFGVIMAVVQLDRTVSDEWKLYKFPWRYEVVCWSDGVKHGSLDGPEYWVRSGLRDVEVYAESSSGLFGKR